MSVAVRSSSRLPISVRLEEELTGGDRQGIGTILGFSSSTEKRATKITKSLRRTFSADMSSKKWIPQYMPGALKKTSSSQEFSEMSVPDSSSGSEGEEDEREERRKRKEAERPGQSDIWSLIQSQKPATDPNSPLPPPYIHPLVKRKSSSLSKKSLEICTESLGSETGSDSFSPPQSGDYTTSDSSDEETAEEPVPVAAEQKPIAGRKESEAVTYNRAMTTTRKSPPLSFPPPLPSISRHDGPRLRIKPHRKDGRLVLEAISIPCQNNFHAERQDGRLLLSFANTAAQHTTTSKEEGEEKEERNVIIQDETVEEIDKVTVKKEIVLEVKILQEDVATGVMKVRRPTLVMSKIVSEVVQLEEREAVKRVPRVVPCAAAAASFSSYNRVAVFEDRQRASRPGKLVAKKKPILVMKPEEFLPMMMRCVELSRPLLLWGPRCIATT